MSLTNFNCWLRGEEWELHKKYAKNTHKLDIFYNKSKNEYELRDNLRNKHKKIVDATLSLCSISINEREQRRKKAVKKYLGINNERKNKC
jgi:hypothetical protein